MKKVMLGVCAAALLGAVACAGVGGISEGDPCGGSTDNCHGGLQCQPVKGRNGDFCCPTPPESSNQSNCHPQ